MYYFFLFENAFHVLHGSLIITDKNVDFQNVFNYILLKQDLSAIIFACKRNQENEKAK